MGANSSITQHTEEFWKKDERMEQIIIPGNPTIYRTVQSNIIEGQSYIVKMYAKTTQQQKALYMKRRVPLTNIVAVYQYSYFTNRENCMEQHYFKVITERVHYRLSILQKKTLNNQQSFYLLSEVFKGYKSLYKFGQSFIVNDQMIGIKNDGSIRVWLNENWALNFPTIKICSQHAMIDQIINTVQQYSANGLHTSFKVQLNKIPKFSFDKIQNIINGSKLDIESGRYSLKKRLPNYHQKTEYQDQSVHSGFKKRQKDRFYKQKLNEDSVKQYHPKIPLNQRSKFQFSQIQESGAFSISAHEQNPLSHITINNRKNPVISQKKYHQEPYSTQNKSYFKISSSPFHNQWNKTSQTPKEAVNKYQKNYHQNPHIKIVPNLHSKINVANTRVEINPHQKNNNCKNFAEDNKNTKNIITNTFQIKIEGQNKQKTMKEVKQMKRIKEKKESETQQLQQNQQKYETQSKESQFENEKNEEDKFSINTFKYYLLNYQDNERVCEQNNIKIQQKNAEQYRDDTNLQIIQETSYQESLNHIQQ